MPFVVANGTKLLTNNGVRAPHSLDMVCHRQLSQLVLYRRASAQQKCRVPTYDLRGTARVSAQRLALTQRRSWMAPMP